MNRFIYIPLYVLLVCSYAFAQIDDVNADDVKKVANNKILVGVYEKIDLKDHGITFFVFKLKNSPSSNGYVVNYGTKAEADKRENIFRDWMIKNALTSDRIVFAYGGEREIAITEVSWNPNYSVIGCPELSLTGPPSSLTQGDIATFTVAILGGDHKNAPKIKWIVKGGKIIRGQGEHSILVRVPEDSVNSIHATVTVETDSGCVLEASEIGQFCSPPSPTLIDEFGPNPQGTIEARTDAFISDIQNNPGSQGYTISYGSGEEIKRREKLIRSYLREERKIDSPNIIFINGGEEKVIRTRFWRVPAGADPSQID